MIPALPTVSLSSEDTFALKPFHLSYEHTHLMNHQPSRFFWMTSTVTPLSKLTSSFPWLVYDWIVIYFSSVNIKNKRRAIRTVIVNNVGSGDKLVWDPYWAIYFHIKTSYAKAKPSLTRVYFFLLFISLQRDSFSFYFIRDLKPVTYFK